VVNFAATGQPGNRATGQPGNRATGQPGNKRRKSFCPAATTSVRDDCRFTLPSYRFLKTIVFLPRRRAASPKLLSFYPDGTPSGRNDRHFPSPACRQPQTIVFSPRRRAGRPKKPPISTNTQDFIGFP
jgi:hypothetical protein